MTGKQTTKEILSDIKELINKGISEKEISEKYFDVWCKYYRAFLRYRTLITEPRNHAVTVYVIQGPTGTGKSKYCMDNFKDAYWKQRSNWWDCYNNHGVVIIDEFYGWLPFDLLLRICDRYPLMVEQEFLATIWETDDEGDLE